MTSLFNDPRLPQRFWDKITPEPNSGCWLWTGCCNKNGSGWGSFYGKTQSLYRLAYEMLIGLIPDDMQLHHTCEIRSCCNPKHLEVLTAKEHSNKPSHLTKIKNNGAAGAISAYITSKPVSCSNGMTFSSARAAAKWIRLDLRNILMCCNGKRKTCGGFMWSWYGDHGASRSWVTRAAGSFTVNLPEAASADTAFGWEVSTII